MPFIHEHQVVPLEGVDGDGPLTHLVAQPSHFDDLDHLPAEHPRPVLVEQLRIDARRLELAQMLLREPFVGREQEDAVQLVPTAVQGQGVLVLEDIGVHQQRLAAAGSHPESELVELRPDLSSFIERGDLVSLGLVRVVGGHLHVQLHEQCLRIAEVAVQVNLGEEQSQVLKILPNDRLLAVGDPPFVQLLRVPDNVLIILQQQLGGQLRQVEVMRRECVVEAVDVVLVHPFRRVIV